jgi:hypothetical protein
MRAKAAASSVRERYFWSVAGRTQRAKSTLVR